MRTYDILADFGLKDTEADQITLNAGCVVAFYRHRYPVTFSRATGESFSTNVGRATELSQPLVVADDVAMATVSSSKTSHIDSLNGSLRPGLNYLAEVMPGDYVFCWMVQSQEAVKDLVSRLKDGKACNEFNDGLKFFGKLSGMRKRLQVMPDGKKLSNFVFNAVGFSEFDGSIYFEPYLQLKSIGLMSDWLQKYGVELNKVIAKSGQGIRVNDIIPALLQVFFGRGVPTNLGLADNGPRLTAGSDNPYSFVVPTEVAKVFGVITGSKPHGLIAYTDLLEVVHGIQSYGGDLTVDASNVMPTEDDAGFTQNPAGKVFQPDGAEYYTNRKVHFTNKYQLGTFMPSVPATSGQKTAWSLISQFLNSTVNEIYTAMRTNAQGKIYPTFVLRQLPFSSGLLSESFVPKPIDTADGPKPTKHTNVPPLVPNPKNVITTKFLELPRWRIHPVFLKNFDIGRSDALRFNFIHVQGEVGAKTGASMTGAFVRDPPIRDDLDIARSGLRPYMKTVPCAPEDIVNRGAGAWMYLLSDFLMGQHLTLTGNLESEGIQQPIVVGDNIEFDETVLHIEGVVHNFQSDGSGNRRFNTSLSLTHGVNAKQATGDDTSLYTGITPEQLTGADPAISRDSENELPEPNKPADRTSAQTEDFSAKLDLLLDQS